MRRTRRSGGCCSPRTPRATSTGRAAAARVRTTRLRRFEQVAATGAPRGRRSSPRGWDCRRAGAAALDADATLDRARFERRIDTAWRRTSYSALTAAAHDAIVASEPEEAGVTDEPATAAAPTASELPLSEMASGPQLGTLIHQALQELDFDAADLTGDAERLADGRRRAPAGAARLRAGAGRRGTCTCARHPAGWRAW